LCGIYGYKDIAFEFATWVNPEFKLYLKELKEKLHDEV